MDKAARGAAALAASNYEDAVQCYTEAIREHPTSVDYYIKRSTAYHRSAKYSEALIDAEMAVSMADKRGRRELIIDSQLRRAIALFFMGQYANAKFVLDIVKSMNDQVKTLAIWESKITTKLNALPEDDPQRSPTASKIPDVTIYAEKPLPMRQSKDEKTDETTEIPQATKPAPAPSEKPSENPPTTQRNGSPTENPKHDWYQTNDQVTFTLMARNVPSETAEVTIGQNELEISYPLANGNDYYFSIEPFYDRIDPDSSSYRITPTKIEVLLKKATPGVRWKTLQGEMPVSGVTGASEEKASRTITEGGSVVKGAAEAAPSYPTSSKKGAKNWDKVAAEDLGDEDDVEGDETSRFFKQLYKGAGTDAQRAMMKSYQESGGTVLSTDWSSVGSKYVAPEPPEGMEAKKY